MTYDPFDELCRPYSVATIHNVLLVDLQSGEDGFQKLRVEHGGKTRDLVGAGQASWGRADVGQYGWLERADWRWPRADVPPGACYFRAYIDPSLRRVPELDDASGARGWRCDAFPGGFTAPPAILPGENGRFVADETVDLAMKIPPEFVRECRRVRRTPGQVLKGFVGDLAGIRNLVICPRADGYGSNGSDERRMAEEWLDRAYGQDAVDIDALEAADATNEELQADQDEFGELLAAYMTYGGQANDLLAKVQAMVDEQRGRSDGEQ